VMALDFREKRGVLGRVVSVDTGVLGETCRVEWTDGTRGTYAATDLAVPTDFAVFGGGKGKESPRPFPQVRARPPACIALRRFARAARRAPGRARPRRCRRARCSARRLGSADAARGVPRRIAEGRHRAVAAPRCVCARPPLILSPLSPQRGRALGGCGP